MKHSSILKFLIGITSITVCTVSWSAQVSVSPGLDSLVTAIEASSPGDELILENGQYGISRDVNVPHTLTIRAASAAAEPTLYNSGFNLVGLSFTGKQAEYHIQGLRFSNSDGTRGLHLTLKEDSKRFTFIENDIFGQLIIQSQAVNDVDNNPLETDEIFIIGNTFFSRGTNPQYLTVNADRYGIIAGNSFDSTEITVTSLNDTETYVIGNEFISQEGYSSSNDFSGKVSIEANSFNRKLARDSNNNISNVRLGINLISIGSNGSTQAIFRNNIVRIGEDDFATPGTPQSYQFMQVNNIQSLSVTNNVFVQQGPPSSTSNDDKNNVAFLGLEQVEFNNNVVMNLTNKLFSDDAVLQKATFNNNICFNSAECVKKIALTTDPELNTITFAPTSVSSPVVDAGTNTILTRDTDGTRNDIGIYGGPMNYSQFLSQRDGNSPFVYPLFDANKSLTNTGELKVRVAAFSKQR